MDADPGPGPTGLTPPHGATTSVRPTVFGVVVAAVVATAVALRPPTADPSVTGLVVAALGGALVVGALWPLVVVRTLGVRVSSAPEDLVVGQLASIEVELVGRASGLSLSCTGSGVTIVDVSSPGSVRLPITVGERGVYRRIRLDVATDAPFGVLWVRRTRLVELHHELLVGPVSVPHTVAVSDLPGHDDVSSPEGIADRGDVVRSVRPYVVGDPAHLVHWPTSARVGELLVREWEPPAARGVALRVDLSTPGDGPAVAAPARMAPDAAVRAAVEHTASLAAGAVESLLAGGSRVVLCTCETSGPVRGEVTDLVGARRRLARAVGGPPATPPDGWPVHPLRVSVPGPGDPS